MDAVHDIKEAASYHIMSSYATYLSYIIISYSNMSQDKKNYKTTLCRHYVQKGYCSLYNNCHFAHG